MANIVVIGTAAVKRITKKKHGDAGEKKTTPESIVRRQNLALIKTLHAYIKMCWR
jgi:hypothetical protein